MRQVMCSRHHKSMRWLIVQGLVILSLALFSACSPAPLSEPTVTPRPTLEPRTPPTPLPAPVQLGAVELGESILVELPGATFVELTYVVDTPQTVTIQAVALSDDAQGNSLDPVVEVIDADNDRIAYDDDGGQGRDGFSDQDTYIEGLQLEVGTYTIRVNAFNGFQAGEVEVLISVGE
jgi:hypothetical protein